MILHKQNILGFTLIELGVFIAIVVILIVSFMPGCHCIQARYQSKQAKCIANIKDQYQAQILYVNDNNGKFHSHKDHAPSYVRSNGNQDSLYDAIIGYMKNTKIMLCPLLGELPQFGYRYTSLDYFEWGYGGWDSVKPELHQIPSHIFSGYDWFANYQHISGTKTKFSFVYKGDMIQENPWPRTGEELTEDKAFIAHRISAHRRRGYVGLWDISHGGSGGARGIEFEELFDDISTSKENPVGYADGHVEIRCKSEIRPRALIGDDPGLWFY